MHTVGFDMAHGDTLVLVDLPDAPRDPRKLADCDNIAFRSCRFRVQSDALLATGSAEFAHMLRPSSQARLQLRRRLAGRLPSGVDYLLDLTPPSEGDQLVYQMTELSLPPGIMRWWSAHEFHGVDADLVNGHDDVCACRRQPAPSPDTDGSGDKPLRSVPPTPEQLLAIKATRDDDAIYATPPLRRIPDYCPVRHRNAIVRLMMLVQGRHSLLDSASRVWTLVAMAKILDCLSLVREGVRQWILSGSNARFIHVLHEEALRIGFAIANVHVTQCSFRVLVCELAPQEAADGDSGREPTPTTVLGRRRGDCGDELNNLVQHAARALVERVSSKDLLQDPNLFPTWEIREWTKLQRLERLLARGRGADFRMALDRLHALMRELPGDVASGLAQAVQRVEGESQALWSMDADRATYVLPQDFERLESILPRLNLVQKLLFSFAWSDLGERCSGPLHREPPVAGKGVRPSPCGVVLDYVEASLRDLVLADPAAVSTHEWAEFLESSVAIPFIKLPLVDLDRIDRQVHDALWPAAPSWVRHDLYPPLNLTTHMLLRLSMNEMKFLPLWADGLDDGSGGVFESLVPPTDMGPDGPGPGYHTGKTERSGAPSASDTLTDGLYAVRLRGDTTAASVLVHDVLTARRPGNASTSREAATASASFTACGTDCDEARAAVLAAHQVPRRGQAWSVEEYDSGWDEERQSDVTGLGSVVVDGFESAGVDVERPYSDLSDSDGSLVVV